MSNIYQFRVRVQDFPSLDFMLPIFVQHNDKPEYCNLLRKIQLHSKIDIPNIEQDYYMILKRNSLHKFKVDNDLGLQNVLKSAAAQDKLEINLVRSSSSYSLPSLQIIKPVVIRLNTCFPAQPSPHHRKDSAISLNNDDDDDLIKFSKRKLPALPNIITAQPMIHWQPVSAPPRLPSLSSLWNSSSNPQLPPLLSPVSPSTPTYTRKRTREGSAPQHPSQFVCHHVDATGKVCCQAFRRSYDLSRHQSIHMKNRPLCYCQICGKKFTRLDALRRHERIQGHKC